MTRFLAPSGLVALSLAGSILCGSVATGAETAATAPFAQVPEQVVFDLLAAARTETSSLISPASLFAALGMARAALPPADAAGGDAGTEANGAEMADPAPKVFEADSAPADKAKAGAPGAAEGRSATALPMIAAALAGRDGPLTIANAVFVDDDLEIDATASAALSQIWRAKVEIADLATGASERINGWVEAVTEGRISKLVEAPLGPVDFAILNAIVFEDEWRAPFDPEKTADRPFYLTTGEGVRTPFITGDVLYPCWEVAGGALIKVDFADNNRYLLLHLPDPQDKGDGAGDSGGRVGGGKSQKPLSALAGAVLDPSEARPVKVALPKLSLEQTLDLGPIFEAAGLTPLLEEGFATLTKMPSRPGRMTQATRFLIDEAGAEAAAASAIVGVRSITPPRPTVIFDRPFTLFVIDPTIPTTLIAGQILDPR